MQARLMMTSIAIDIIPPKSQVLTSSLTNVYVPYSKSLIFARLPVLRLSRITTLCPSLINDAQRLEPIKPLRQRLICSYSVAFYIKSFNSRVLMVPLILNLSNIE